MHLSDRSRIRLYPYEENKPYISQLNVTLTTLNMFFLLLIFFIFLTATTICMYSKHTTKSYSMVNYPYHFTRSYETDNINMITTRKETKTKKNERKKTKNPKKETNPHAGLSPE